MKKKVYYLDVQNYKYVSHFFHIFIQMIRNKLIMKNNILIIIKKCILI